MLRLNDMIWNNLRFRVKIKSLCEDQLLPLLSKMKTWVNQILEKELLQDALGQRRWKAWGKKKIRPRRLPAPR
jgi:hypothetical protein